MWALETVNSITQKEINKKTDSTRRWFMCSALDYDQDPLQTWRQSTSNGHNKAVTKEHHGSKKKQKGTSDSLSLVKSPVLALLSFSPSLFLGLHTYNYQCFTLIITFAFVWVFDHTNLASHKRYHEASLNHIPRWVLSSPIQLHHIPRSSLWLSSLCLCASPRFYRGKRNAELRAAAYLSTIPLGSTMAVEARITATSSCAGSRALSSCGPHQGGTRFGT